MNKEIRGIILEGLEQRIEPLNAARTAAAVPSRGWLRAVREAIGLSQARVAERGAVKRQSYAQFEAAEEKGSISVASLRRAAEAMDCELVYFVVPKAAVARTYCGLAEIHDPSAKHLKATEHSIALRGRAPDSPAAGSGREPG
jgi:predicted DNA-binding mobile mystery protein A